MIKKATSQQPMRTIKVKEKANHHHPKENPPTPGPRSSCGSHGTLLWLRTWAAADAHPPGTHLQPKNCCSLNIILLTMWIFSPKDNYLFHLWMNQSGTCSRAASEECKKLGLTLREMTFLFFRLFARNAWRGDRYPCPFRRFLTRHRVHGARRTKQSRFSCSWLLIVVS